MYEITRESDIQNIGYFRDYALPVLSREQLKDYVSIKTHDGAESEAKESYSVLIKKDLYKKSDAEALAKACMPYIDYLPSSMYVSELVYKNSTGGRFNYTKFEKMPTGEWSKENEVVTVFSAEYIDNLMEEDKAKKKLKKELQ
jgi:hypothetical protein